MGERWQHEWLRDQRPAFALMRQWASFSRDLDRLQKEIGRLRGLVYDASLELERAGKPRQARRCNGRWTASDRGVRTNGGSCHCAGSGMLAGRGIVGS